MSLVWVAKTAREGRDYFRVGREGNSLVAEWPGVGTLTVDRAGTNPQFTAVGSADSAVVAKLRASAVPALLRHLRGGLALHASAVAFDGRAVAFLGDSGAGKSTLAFALSTVKAGQYALLSDDCLSVSEGLVLPGDQSSWIDGPAKVALGVSDDGPRSAVPALRVAGSPASLRWFVHLEFGEQICVTRLQGSAVAGILTRAVIRFVVDEPEVLRADLERLANLAADTEVLRLVRPRGWEHLPATMSTLASVLV